MNALPTDMTSMAAARPKAGSDQIAVSLTNVSKSFGTRSGPLLAVSDVSFTVRKGEFVSIIGPSGCGKSTLFNIIGGFIPEHDGTLRFGDHEPSPFPTVGVVFQEESIFPWRDALDNVALPLEVVGVPREARLQRATEALRLVGLAGFESRFPNELSGGMRQRVAIARTLVARPQILLMDEPFAALDEQTRILIGDSILNIQQSLKQTTILITHNLTEAVQLSDRVLVMSYRPGRIKSVVEIDLPRPRSSDVVGSEAFGRLVAELWGQLKDEATKYLESERK